MHEAVMAIKENISCVEIIEAENVPEEAGATSTMENMIQQGAELIFATAFNHQYPALELANKYPDVIFEHAGGWEMSGNFANFFGEPPDVWYILGVAAGMMTEMDKLGFIAAFPLGWSLTFANAFHLGAASVNPDVETTVTYTFSWGDSAKEADATNSLINQGVDAIISNADQIRAQRDALVNAFMLHRSWFIINMTRKFKGEHFNLATGQYEAGHYSSVVGSVNKMVKNLKSGLLL